MPVKGQKMSEEHKEKIRQALIGKNKGKKRTEEYKNQMSKRMSGKNNPMYGKKRTLSKETVEKMIKSRKGYRHSDETKRKIAEGNKGKIISEETKQKISKANKGRAISTETRNKLRLANIKRYSDPKERKKVSLKSKERWADPEYKEKMLEIMNTDEHREKIKKGNIKFRAENPERVKEINRKATNTRRKNMKNSNYKEKVYNSDFRQKMSDQAKEQWANPEIRNKMIKGMLKSWQNEDRIERVSKLMENQGHSKLYNKGWHNSPKAGNIMYKSSWELYTFLMLDEDEGVLNYSSEPCIISYEHNNRDHSYSVDLKIEFSNLSVLFVEIKPNYMLEDPQTKSKIKKAKEVLGELFQVWTEKEIPEFNTCYWELSEAGII